jgi:hypothetical protein
MGLIVTGCSVVSYADSVTRKQGWMTQRDAPATSAIHVQFLDLGPLLNGRDSFDTYESHFETSGG